MKRSRLLLWIAAVTGCVVLTMAVVAHYEFVTKVRLVNESSIPLTNVRITMAEKVIWSGSIAAGETRNVYGLPPNDGTVGISFEAAGRRVHEEFGYVTPGMAERYVVVVRPSFELRIAEDDP